MRFTIALLALVGAAAATPAPAPAAALDPAPAVGSSCTCGTGEFILVPCSVLDSSSFPPVTSDDSLQHPTWYTASASRIRMAALSSTYAVLRALGNRPAPDARLALKDRWV